LSQGKKHQVDPAEGPAQDDLIELGKVGRPFGLRGEVRIRPYNPESNTLMNVKEVFLKPGHGEYKTYRVLNARAHQDLFVAALEGCRTREDAEGLRGQMVYVRLKDLPELDDDEYYWLQLIGMEVWCKDKKIGQISNIQETAPEMDGNDILVVDSAQGELLVPAVTDVIQQVDLDAGRIILEPGRGYDPQV
jgi:16S rRNA processing protein RimM